MSGDYTRFTYDPLRDFDRVRAEQGRVLVDADLNELSDAFDHRLRALALDVLGPCTAPVDQSAGPGASAGGFLIQAAGSSFTIGLGRLYVHGLELDNHGVHPYVVEPGLQDKRGTVPTPYEAQPYYPNPPAIPSDGLDHVVYVDAWDREVTAASDRSLVDSAIGFDTAARMQTVWQVKVLPNDATGLTCSTPDDKVPGYLSATAPSGARLTVAAVGVPADDDPCSVPADGGYRGWDNRLYRVEVHDGGDLSSATFKWSRDNASVETTVLDVDSTGTVLTVARTGRDDVQRIREGAWVEVLDDAHELDGVPGALAQVVAVDAVDDMSQTVTLSAALPAAFLPLDPAARTRVRQWDHTTTTETIAATLTSAGYVLEDGIQVTFTQNAPDTFHTGDFWTFAARSADASLQLLDAAPPQGPIHFYGRLAIWSSNGVQDCRGIWPNACDCGCDGECTACVTVASHASGQLTIQMAVDRVEKTGGTVCIAAGKYTISDPIIVRAARGLTIRGHRYATFILFAGVGAAITITNSFGVRVLDLAVILTAPPKAAVTTGPSTAGAAAATPSAVGPALTTLERAQSQDSRSAWAQAVPEPKQVPQQAVGGATTAPTTYNMPSAGFGLALAFGIELTGCVVFDSQLLSEYAAIAAVATSGTGAGGTASSGNIRTSAGVVTSTIVGALAIRDCSFVAGFGITSWHSQAVVGGYTPPTTANTAASIGGRYAMLVGVEVLNSIVLGLRSGVWWDPAVITSEVTFHRSIFAGLLSAGITWHAATIAGHNRVDSCIIRGTRAGVHSTTSALELNRSWVSASAPGNTTLAKVGEAFGDAVVLAAPILEGHVANVTVRECLLEADRYAVSAIGPSNAITLAGNTVKCGVGGFVQEAGSYGQRWTVVANDIQVTGKSSAVDGKSTLAGIWLTRAEQADIRANRLHDIGSLDTQGLDRVGIALEDSVSCTVASNTLINIVGSGRPQQAVGIHAWTSIGRLDVIDNIIAIDGSGSPTQATDASAFAPILIEAGFNELGSVQSYRAPSAAFATAPSPAAETGAAPPTAPTSQPNVATAPLQPSPNVMAPYVARALDSTRRLDTGLVRMAQYGAYLVSSSDGVAAVRGNSVDTNGTQPAVNVSVLSNLIFSANRVRHAGTSVGYSFVTAVVAGADSMVVDGNYVEAPITSDQQPVSGAMQLDVLPTRVAVSTNVVRGAIAVGGAPLSAPWAALNVTLT